MGINQLYTFIDLYFYIFIDLYLYKFIFLYSWLNKEMEAIERNKVNTKMPDKESMYSFYLKFKAVHPDSVLIILEDSEFCCLYGNDAIIVSYLSRYTPKAGLICGNMVIQIGLRINRSMNYVVSKLKEARISYYIINRTTGYKEEDKFISEDQEAYKKYLPEAKKYVLIKSKAEAIKLKIDKLLDYPDNAIEKLNKIENILEE